MALPAGLVFVPYIMGAIFSFALVGGPILHDIKTKSDKPNDIYVETSDVKDVEEGYLRIICVVQSKSWLRTAKFSYQSYTRQTALGAEAVIPGKIDEAICGDVKGQSSLVPGVKYQVIKVKLEPGNNYYISYGSAGALSLWTFAKSTTRINSADIPKFSGRTHYVYFDEGGYFAAGGRFYKKEQLYKQ